MNLNLLRKIKRDWRWLSALVFFLCLILALFFLRIYHIDGKTSLELGAPRDSYCVMKTNLLIKRYWPLFKEKKVAPNKIGWISDIHADRFKRRDVNSGLMIPREYSTYLPQVFDAMQRQGVDTVIATGDNTNSGDDNYARDLSHIAQEKHMRVIWVTGNHDNSKVMSILGVNGNRYYAVDYANTRIIILDNVESDGDYQGAIGEPQLEWLRTQLKTSKPVIIAMHIPIFDENFSPAIHDLAGGDYSNVGDLLNRYSELENILQTNKNVKLVLSGHWHVPWHKEYQGIAYYGEAALTRQYYAGAYALINLEDDSIDYLFAK